MRGNDLGSNPHSKGEHFSRSMKDFLEIIIEIIIKILDKKKNKIEINIINLIIYIKIINLFDWKSNILYILYK